jgi:hypothetical protein
MLKFDIMCIKEDFFWKIMWGKIKTSHHINIYFLKFIILIHPKFNLNFLFSLKFYTIYLFELLVLVETRKHLNVFHKKNKMFRNNMFQYIYSNSTWHFFSYYFFVFALKGVN